MLQTLAPELGEAAPGARRSSRIFAGVIRMGAERTAGMINFADVVARASVDSIAAVRAIGATLDRL